MRSAVIAGLLGAGLLTATALTSFAAGPAMVAVDRTRIRAETRQYRLLSEGRPVGTMSYRVAVEAGVVTIEEKTEMAPDTREETLSQLDGRTFHPRWLRIRGQYGPTRRRAEYRWDAGRLTGSNITTYPDHEPTTKYVDERFPVGAFERTSVFALLAGMPLGEGVSYPFEWFNGHTAGTHTVALKVTGTEDVEVPAGRFTCFRVALTGGEPSNVVHVTRARPRQVVRIEVVDQPFVFELMP